MLKFINSYDAIAKGANTKAKGENRDCVVRAFMNAASTSYDEAHDTVAKWFDRKPAQGTTGFTINAFKREGETVNGLSFTYIGSHPLAAGARWNPETRAYDITQYNLRFKTLCKPRYPKQGYTVAKFAEAHPVGRYIIIVQRHALAVVDGVIYDNWDQNDALFRNKGRDQRKALHVYQLK
jgi:hypothetical protein